MLCLSVTRVSINVHRDRFFKTNICFFEHACPCWQVADFKQTLLSLPSYSSFLFFLRYSFTCSLFFYYIGHFMVSFVGYKWCFVCCLLIWLQYIVFNYCCFETLMDRDLSVTQGIFMSQFFIDNSRSSKLFLILDCQFENLWMLYFNHRIFVIYEIFFKNEFV